MPAHSASKTRVSALTSRASNLSSALASRSWMGGASPALTPRVHQPPRFLLELHHQRSGARLSNRLATALHRDLVHPDVAHRLRRQCRLQLVAADELGLQLPAIEEHA